MAADRGELRRQLQQWVKAGLIDASQAARIDVAEAGGKLPPAAEPGAAQLTLPPPAAPSHRAAQPAGSAAEPGQPGGPGPGIGPSSGAMPGAV